MDVPPTPPAPSPPTPYRAGKALAEIIPPDRRRLKAAALVVSSMVAGVVLWVLGGWAVEMIRGERSSNPTATPSTSYVAGRIGPAVLRGPEGTLSLPPPRRTVVNVWLQGCKDCMPAFDAMAMLQDEGGLGADVPVVNVAYGEADMTWAQRYGVARSLVFDPGGAQVVKPLGIGTFTTLVVDPDGSIIHRDRPDRPGFAARIRAAFPHPTSQPQALGHDVVQQVVALHTAGIRRTCWERHAQDEGRASANVTVSLTVAPDGTVSAASSAGDSPVVGRCIEAQVRSWRFPAPGSATSVTVTIPFKFVRE